MKVTIRRLDSDGRYETLVRRDDGVSFHIKGVAHRFTIPHDLAHFLVEKARGLRHGFWGSSHLEGRRKPKAAERSKAVLKANARPLTEAEVLVRIFNDTIEQGHTQASPVLQERLKERWAAPGSQLREISGANIAEIFASYSKMQLKWRDLPVGGTLELFWSN